ncbi:Peptidase C19, ubiquitin carboxyl-terminal hydrolase 2 [Corchorus olitorius]|uniref:Ubiquitin carboxyl-terminal hydrolase n=1 Tax=Corchorus olitorius TaxID=93759 RepID=A0A1R3J7Z2_9ROSI|nr:Peptidase C19, ubiquitin carboxyl-terminal hydrolase 2 [Corchorus olitorius]
MEATVTNGSGMTIEAAAEGTVDLGNGSLASACLKRKIVFHPARKPFDGFKNCGDGDFRIETLNPGPDPKRVNGVGTDQAGIAGRKADGSDVWENGLDPVLSLRISFRKIGAGLENLGNTCFLNSVLQCLTYTEPLVAYLQSGRHRNSCRIAGFCALCAMQKHVSRALESTGRSLAPSDLVSNLRCISRNFRNSRQEDAHEYMVNLLESMHKCCLPSGVPSESPSAYEKSLVHKIFGGRLRSQVKCMQCHSCSNKFDPFLDLSLEIVKADSLHKALKNFTAAELLDGGERQYQCERCKQKVKAIKQLTVSKAPHVLTIHLKRFRAHDFGQKIDRKIEFGPTLDMKPFVSGSNEGDLKYTLYGVLVHYGWSTHSGHYYCFVRTSSGMWYSLDDNRVVQVSEKTVLDQKAYMLFYVRDRRNPAPRKPIDVLQKDNLKANMNGKSVLNQNPKKQVQNGAVENKLCASGTSAGMTNRDTVNGDLSKETIKKEVPSQRNNVQLVAESSVLSQESVLPSSNVPVLKNSSQAAASNLQPSAHSVVVTGDSSNIENSTVTTCAKDSNCNEGGNSNKDVGVPETISLNCGGLQNSASDNLGDIDRLQKINLPSNNEVSSSDPVKDCIDIAVKKAPAEAPSSSNTDKTSKNAVPIRSPSRPDCETSQVKDVLNNSTSVKSLSKKLDDGAKKSILEIPSSLPNGSLETEDADSTPCRKSKKKLLKRQLKNMHISKFFRTSLLIHSKKKHKRSKKRGLNGHILAKEILLDKDCLSSDLEPSTSEKSRTISLGSSRHGRKKPANDTAPKDFSNSAISLMNTMQGKFKDRTDQNGTVLATDQQVERDSGTVSEANRHNSRVTDSWMDSKLDATLIRRHLGETTVARWDDVDIVSPARTIQEDCTESVAIGYVLNEWDEEYDQGKRKKIRHRKHNFGGPNLFQQIATEKAQLKKAKLDRSSSGNRPFRI